MKRIFVFLAMVGIMIAVSAPAAFADSFSYDFTTVGNVAFGGGVLTVTGTEISPGEYLISDGTITLFSNSAPGSPSGASGTLIPITANSGSANGYYPGAVLSPSGAIYYDDLLYSSSDPLLDAAGLLFNIGGTEFDIYSNGSPTSGGLGYSIYDNNGLADTGNFNVLESPVPEPSSLLLLGTGIFGLVGVLSRRMLVSQHPSLT